MDNVRSMTDSLSLSIDKVSEIDKKISQIELIEKFHNSINFVIKILINLIYY